MRLAGSLALLALALALAGPLAACGKKGPLEAPPGEQAEEEAKKKRQ
ncbi:MAG TPA: lipopeptide [Alphaproteobacteria bacterium]|nr:lipopeptide [Alphaproteobacteria bacterium]MDP6269640.1 lipopeptide [Alphaproteobacteria bacterium]MDP7428335.1 lipopeptide [Alphaproteobacteria bacterium]HJM50323.1 lipopeptide [Alphaproteobacteria bacterium]